MQIESNDSSLNEIDYMKKLILLFVLLTFGTLTFAQPFRYIRGNEYDRDSVKLLKIKSYKEYTSAFAEPEVKKLSHLVEYDTNGNVIRDLRINLENGLQHQTCYRYSPKNLLLEQLTYTKDTLDLIQRFAHKYDAKGNEIETSATFYSDGKASSSSRTIYCYDTLNQLIEMRSYNHQDKEVYHYEYRYNQFGQKTNELVFDQFGKLLYNRSVERENSHEHEPYGFPSEHNAEIEALMKETMTIHVDGGFTIENGYDIRIFNKNKILLYWYQKHFQYHWYTYTYWE